VFSIFAFIHPSPTQIYTLSLHDALPISAASPACAASRRAEARIGEPLHRHARTGPASARLFRDVWPGSAGPRDRRRGSCSCCPRSEEHTSELQSPCNLICRLLLEKKKKI